MTPGNDERDAEQTTGDVLKHSFDDWPGTRLNAVEAMRGRPREDPRILDRLVQLLDDPIVTVEVAAAEALVEGGDIDGLTPVFAVLGLREDDPDSDYITYMLAELHGSGRLNVLASADKVLATNPDDAVRTGVERVREYLSYSGQ